MSKLTCGGKGPCCHVGYSHRHCEHCDVVIDTRSSYTWPHWPVQPVFPYIGPHWYSNTGNALTAGAATYAINTTYQGNTGDFTKSLAAHTCEGEP